MHFLHLYESCVNRGRVFNPWLLSDGRDHQDVTVQLIVTRGRRTCEGQRGEASGINFVHLCTLRLGTAFTADIIITISGLVVIANIGLAVLVVSGIFRGIDIIVDDFIVGVSVISEVCRCLEVYHAIACCEPRNLILVNHFWCGNKFKLYIFFSLSSLKLECSSGFCICCCNVSTWAELWTTFNVEHFYKMNSRQVFYLSLSLQYLFLRLTYKLLVISLIYMNWINLFPQCTAVWWKRHGWSVVMRLESFVMCTHNVWLTSDDHVLLVVKVSLGMSLTGSISRMTEGPGSLS